MKWGASGGAFARAGAVRTRALLALLVLASTVGSGRLSRPVHAAEADSDRVARTHFRQGEAHYAAGAYPQAVVEYQAGYDVHPLPGFLVNIAQCQRRMGDLARARATYGKFILVAPDSPLVPEVRSLIEELDRLIAETETAQRAPSVVVPATKESARTATVSPPALEAAPPANTSAASAVGADLTVVAAPVTPSSGTAAGGSAPSRRWWLWGAGAVVLAAGITTVALILSAPEATTIHDGSLGSLRR